MDAPARAMTSVSQTAANKRETIVSARGVRPSPGAARPVVPSAGGLSAAVLPKEIAAPGDLPVRHQRTPAKCVAKRSIPAKNAMVRNVQAAMTYLFVDGS